MNLKVCYKFTQSLYSKPINLHGYIWANVGHFCAKLCKFHTFFYYTVIDVSALTMGKKKPFLYLIYRLLITLPFPLSTTLVALPWQIVRCPGYWLFSFRSIIIIE